MAVAALMGVGTAVKGEEVPSLDLNFDGQLSSYRRTSTSPTAAKANGNELATNIISCTRSTTATFVNSSGVLATAAANVPRVEFDGNGNPLGLLVEEDRTNYLWLSDVGSTFSVPSTSPTTGPDGSTGNYVPLANSLSDRFQWAIPIGTFNVDDKVTASWHVKRLQGTPSSYAGELRIRALEGFSPVEPTTAYKIADLANGWERWAVDLTVTDDTATSGNPTENVQYLRLYIGYVQDDGNNGFNDDVAYYGFQLEKGEGATSYIPNTGASGSTTRDDDHITLATSLFGYNGSAMTSVVEATLPHAVNGSGTPRIFEISDGGSTIRPQLLYPSQSSSNLTAQWRDDNNGTYKTTNLVTGFTYPLSVTAAVRTDGTTGSYAVDGSVGGGVTIPATTSAVTRLSLGSTGTGAHIVAHIRRFRYWPRAVNDAQLSKLTNQ